MPFEFATQCNPAFYQNIGIPLNEKDGCLYAASGAPIHLLNGVCSCLTEPTREVVSHVAAFFSKQQLLYSWWVEEERVTPEFEEALHEEGMQLEGTFPCMHVLKEGIRKPKIPGEMEMKQVETKDELGKWAALIAEVFHFPESVAAIYTTLFKGVGLEGPFYHLIGKKEGRTIATGSVLCTPEGAYLYNIATHISERKKGYASALAYRLLEIAKKQGCDQMALVSSPQAANIYTQLGFETLTNYRIYL